MSMGPRFARGGWSISFIALIPAAVLAVAIASTIAEPPATPTTKPAADSAWGSDAPSTPAGGKSVEWGGTMQEPLTRDTSLTFGPPGCPVCIVGNQVWNIKAGKPVATIGQKYSERDARVISADGKLLAGSVMAEGDHHKGAKSSDETATITIWSLETGAQVTQIPDVPRNNTVLMVFGPEGTLICGGRDSEGQCQVYNATTGKPTGTITLDKSPKCWATTPDGRYLAVAGHDSLGVYNLVSGARVATMHPPVLDAPPQIVIPPTPPAAGPKAPPAPPRAGVQPAAPHADPNAVTVKPLRTPRNHPSPDMVFVLAWAQSLKFSPDGRELALFTTNPSPYLFVWDTHGACVYQAPLSLDIGADGDVEWLPNGAGWLVAGRIILDRKLKREVGQMPVEFGTRTVSRFIDQDHLLTVRGRVTNPMLDTVVIPWERINKSVADMTSKTPANLRPGQPVSVEITTANLRGDTNQTRDALFTAFARHMAKDGIQITEGQDAVFKINFTEQAGKTLPIYEGGFGMMGGHDTGRTVIEALGNTTVELYVKGQDAPVWSFKFSSQSSRMVNGEVNDQNVRQTMIDSVRRELEKLKTPYFLPLTPGVEPLPIAIE